MVKKAEQSGQNPLMIISGTTIGVLAALLFVAIVYYFVKNPKARPLCVLMLCFVPGRLTDVESQKFRSLITSILRTLLD